MRGLGVFDAWTIHKGARVPRCVGDVAISWNGMTLVGFETHRGLTYLGTSKPLGKVLKGSGNNAEDGTEGAVYRNAYGTYLHGSLLPKNPHFADHLLTLALQRKYSNQLLVDVEVQSYAGHIGNGTNGSAPATVTKKIEENVDILKPIDDSLEWEAHASLLESLGLYTEAIETLRNHTGFSRRTERE